MFVLRSVVRRRLFLLACVIAAQAVALQMVVQTPFLSDDSPNQTIRGYIAAHHQTFWSFLRADAQ
jgi:hypothetical protein